MDVSFNTVVSIFSGFIVLGTFFNAWFSLRERVVKLEASQQAHSKEYEEHKELLKTLIKENTDLKNEVVKLQTILTKP